MCRDAVSGLVWTCTERHVFKYCPDNEDRSVTVIIFMMVVGRHVWRYYAEKGDFERARRHALVDDGALETVHRRQAQSLILEGKCVHVSPWTSGGGQTVVGGRVPGDDLHVVGVGRAHAHARRQG